MKPELVWEIEHSLALSGQDIYEAAEARTAWYQVVAAMFDQYDYVLAPSLQVFPFDKALPWPSSIGGREMDTYHRWMETVSPWSMTGHLVVSMLVGFDDRRLPMGVQIICRNHADGRCPGARACLREADPVG